uniref:Spermatogenesis-associated protein 1 n=1 Tax=Pogona vitticeps TaxID=103695 RepID=A0A6J0TT32_9SAUR
MLGYKIYDWGEKLSRTLHEPGQKSRNMPSSQMRPPTSELLELHVFYVPEEIWNFKLNTVPVDDINNFFSAGFIRVSPHMTLRTLREQLGDYLGEDTVVDKYIFLKCIGKKLVVVKAKQETELKLKSFAPPYAFNPELYLLPGVESIYSSSTTTPERYHNNTEYLLGYTPNSLVVPNPEVVGNPKRLGSSLKSHLKQEKGDLFGLNATEQESLTGRHIQLGSDQKENEKIQEKYSSETKGENTCNTGQGETITSLSVPHDLTVASHNSDRKPRSEKIHLRMPLSQTQERSYTSRKEEKYSKPATTLDVNLNHEQEENNLIQVYHLPQKTKGEISMLDANTENGGNLTVMGRHTTGDSGIPESLGERDLEYLHSQRSQRHAGITKTAADVGNIQDGQMDENNLKTFMHPSHYFPPPSPPHLVLSINRAQVPNTVFPTEGSDLSTQLHHIKMERKDLEKTRMELMKKVKGLFEQSKLRRCQARDSWKKKYFEVKKATVSMEGVLNKLREDLELHYQKLLIQLEARDIKKKRNNLQHTTNSKNNTIIQITTLQHEIDQLRRRLDNMKIKLVIEIKMRKQATSDLRALKAELAHKKAQSSVKRQSQKQVP